MFDDNHRITGVDQTIQHFQQSMYVRHVQAGDVVWHYHGVLTPPPGAVSLVEVEGRGSLFYVDRVSTATGIDVTVLEESEEARLTYLAVRETLESTCV